MKILEFKYTKDDGRVSQRTVVELSPPSKNHFGIDISELDIDLQLAFTKDMNFLKTRYDRQIADVMANYDIKHNFRNFDPSKMENLIVEMSD
jgi:hypothetical protein